MWQSKFWRENGKYFLCFLICLGGLLPNVLGAESTDISRLRYDLLTGYDRNSRPIQNHQNATRVGVKILVKGFEFDELRSVFTLHAWTVLSWKDDHLKWPSINYGNLTLIHFAAHEVWQPDLSVYNNLDKSEIDHFGNTRIVGNSQGWLVWVPPTKLQVGCSSNLRKWPYDTQTCVMILGSWAHDGSAINIFLPPNATKMDTSTLLPNREWKLLSNTIRKRTRYFDCCPGIPFPDFIVTVTLGRESSTHTAAVVVPALAIAAAILIAFWIQPGATERLALILIVTIINALYLNNIYVAIPNNGDNIPLVILFYRDSLLMVAVALIWTICLRYLAATKRTSPVPLPSFIKNFLDSCPAKVLCLDPRPLGKSSNGSGSEDAVGDDEGKLVDNRNPYQEDWAWLAHLLDRIAFVIYLIVYICFMLALL